MLSLHTIIFQKNEGRAHLPVPHSFHFSLLCENLLFCVNPCQSVAQNGPYPMQLVVVMAVRKAVRAATTTFTAISIKRFFIIVNVQCYVTSFHDFCHDSAKQASLMALAAPKVQCSMFNVQRFSSGPYLHRGYRSCRSTWLQPHSIHRP